VIILLLHFKGSDDTRRVKINKIRYKKSNKFWGLKYILVVMGLVITICDKLVWMGVLVIYDICL